MDEVDATRVYQPAVPAVYLIVHRGDALLEVVELPQDGRMTIGRASSNRIVLQDPKCSREHCELYSRNSQWYVRDLDSRNGLTIDGDRLTTDHALQIGETIGIGMCTLLFSDQHPGQVPSGDGTDSGFHIIERQSGTQFDNPALHRMREHRDGAADLFRLARQMAATVTVEGLCSVVLDGLVAVTGAGIGGVLVKRDARQLQDASQLRAKALHGCQDATRFSSYLSNQVLTDQEALLALDISSHSALSVQESLRKLAAEAAICAPIRHDKQVFGVIHLYSTDLQSPFSQQDLEFVLAVADQMGDQLFALIEREQLAEGLEKSQQQISELHHQLGEESELVGTSSALDQVRKSIFRVAPTDALVLIRGESGVGKELVARALHFNSRRAAKPYVCVNCAALSESLLESELFGHEKGAFTGAAGRRIGKFEQADGGTLFLDEIGEMSLEVQAKFLRVLEEQPFERVGGEDPIQVDVRVVTATNRDLERAVREGKFRRDLFFRLQVIEIVVPPLREHPEDVPSLAQHFVNRFSASSAHKIHGFSTAAIQKLQSHPWPGNVRELRNVVERAVILADREILQPEDVVLTSLRLDDVDEPSSPSQPAASVEEPMPTETAVDPLVDLFGSFIQRETSLDELDSFYIQAVLDSTNWNKSKASRILQIERTTLDRRLKKYGLSRPGEQSDEEE